MKFQKQPDTFAVNDALENLAETLAKGENGKGVQKHGPLLPETVRCIICGPSNCGKTNLMFSLLTEPKGLKYANIYIFSKSLQQPKYKMLEQIMRNIPDMGYFTFTNSEDVLDPENAKKNSIMVFDDVATDKQDHMRSYFSMGRHRGIDSFYLVQTYTRLPKHLLRDNANLIILFKQDDQNLKHVYNDHVNTDMTFDKFKYLCQTCWNKQRYGFVTINKDSEMKKGRYRFGLDTFLIDI